MTEVVVCAFGGAVPVLFAWFEDHQIARRYLELFIAIADYTGALGDVEDLDPGVGVELGSLSRSEGDPTCTG